MNVPFVLILIHASVATVVKFDFVPPKSYELEVNQTRTNLKLKVGRNGDGHIIENILKPLFDGSGQVGIEESDKNCTKKTCKKKCVKRKKVCLKGDLDCEEVQETSDEDCDDSTITPDITPTSYETVVTENHNNDTEETPIYQTGEIETDDIKETNGRVTETFGNVATEEFDTTPDLWGTYGEVEDVEYIVHSSDKTTTRYSVIDNLIKVNEGHDRTLANNTKENTGVNQERNEKTTNESGSRQTESSNLENSSNKSVGENSSVQKLINFMKENHDPTSNLFLQTEPPLTNHSESKSEKNLTRQDCKLHESHPQLIFINENSHSRNPSTFRTEESVVALLKKVSTKNKTTSEEKMDSKNTQNAPSGNETNFERSEKTNQLKDSDASATKSTKDSNPEKSDLVKESIPGESKSIVSAEEGTVSKKYQKSAAEHLEEMHFADNDDVLEADKKVSKQTGLKAISESAGASDNRDSEISKNETSAHQKSLVIMGEEQNGRIYPENHVLKRKKQEKEVNEEDKPENKRKDSTDAKFSEEHAVSYQGLINNVYTDNFLFRHGKHTSLESNATHPSKDIQKVSDNPKRSDADNLQENQETKKPKSEHVQKTQLKEKQANDSNDNFDINPNLEEDNGDLNADKDRKDEDDDDDKDDEDEEDHDGEDDEGGTSEDDEDGDAADENQLPEGDGPNEDSGSESPVEKRKPKEKQEKNNNNQEDDDPEYEKHGDNDPKSEELNDDRKLPSEEDDPEKELHKRHGVENDIVAERGKIVGDQFIRPKERNALNMAQSVNDSATESKIKKRRKPPSVLTEFNGHIDSLEKVVYDDDYENWDDDASVVLNFDDIPKEIIDRVQNSDLTDPIVPMDLQHQSVQGRPMEVVTPSHARKDVRAAKGERRRRDQPPSEIR